MIKIEIVHIILVYAKSSPDCFYNLSIDHFQHLRSDRICRQDMWKTVICPLLLNAKQGSNTDNMSLV